MTKKKIYRQASPMKGVEWHVKSQCWKVMGSRYDVLGYYETIEEAKQARIDYKDSLPPKQAPKPKQGSVEWYLLHYEDNTDIEAQPPPPDYYKLSNVFDETGSPDILRLKEEVRLNHSELKHKPYRVRHRECVGFVESLDEAQHLLRAFKS
jgi:hypothetical protein